MGCRLTECASQRVAPIALGGNRLEIKSNNRGGVQVWCGRTWIVGVKCAGKDGSVGVPMRLSLGRTGWFQTYVKISPPMGAVVD